MYEYITKSGFAMGMDQAKKAKPFERAIAVSPVRRPTPVTNIDNCAMGRCGSMGTPSEGGRLGRPVWQYALLGIGLGAGIYMLNRRARMMQNPEEEGLTRAEVVRQAAAISIQAGIPTILWGPPGIGKTQWVQGLGKAMSPMNKDEPVRVFTLIGSTRDPTDIGGMPTADGSLLPPRWARDILDRSIKGERSILFLDEFSSMNSMVHAALLRVVNEKVAGETDFDPKDGPLKGHAVHIIAAANRPKHGAGARDLPPPAANRFIHFKWPKSTAVEWADGMLFGWKEAFYFNLPEDWRSGPFVKEARQMAGAFIKYRESKLSPVLFAMPGSMDNDDDGNRATGGAWPSPRSWEMAADVLAATWAAEAPKNVQIDAVVGAIGVAASSELFNFTKYKDLPNPEEILASPEDWDTPEDPTKLFIVSNTLVNALLMKMTVERYDAAWKAIVHAVKTRNDVASLTIAAREMASMKGDKRFHEVLEKYQAPKFVGSTFAPAFKKMKLQ